MVICDEAHNFESVAADAASFDLGSTDIGGAMDELDKCYRHVSAYGAGDVDQATTSAPIPSADNLLTLKTLLIQLEDELLRVAPSVPADGAVRKAEWLIDVLAGMHIDVATAPQLFDELEKASAYYSTSVLTSGGAAPPSSGGASTRIDTFCRCVRVSASAFPSLPCCRRCRDRNQPPPPLTPPPPPP